MNTQDFTWLKKGISNELEITEYHLTSPKLHEEATAILLSDLHGTRYGKEFIQTICSYHPDFILLPGDIYDEWCDIQKTTNLLRKLKDIPMFYSTGNHEERMDEYFEVLEDLRNLGVHVLQKKVLSFSVRSNLFEIGGISSRLTEKSYEAKEINALYQTEGYRILLSHRPHWKNLYNAMEVDLIVSGHAHGGQWRMPGGHKGLIAPQQGFFPTYTEGLLKLKHAQLLIGRGLVKEYHGIPRLFNPPELVVIHFHP